MTILNHRIPLVIQFIPDAGASDALLTGHIGATALDANICYARIGRHRCFAGYMTLLVCGRVRSA